MAVGSGHRGALVEGGWTELQRPSGAGHVGAGPKAGFVAIGRRRRLASGAGLAR